MNLAEARDAWESGAWVEFTGRDGRVVGVLRGWESSAPSYGVALVVAPLGGGPQQTCPAELVERWMPRPGDWVRRTAEAFASIGRQPDEGQWKVARVDTGKLSSSSDVYMEGLGGCIGLRWLEPCAAPASRAVPWGKAYGPPAAVIPREPRDHNATCPRCGGRAYQGIGDVRCVEPVCDDPETRMPHSLREVPCYGADNCRPMERVWSALGRGVAVRHPLREGAIQAWRAAVAAKDGAA